MGVSRVDFNDEARVVVPTGWFRHWWGIGGLLVLGLVACSGNLPGSSPGAQHLHAPGAATALAPLSLRPVKVAVYPSAPQPRAAQEVFSVVVNDVPVKTLLFALARDNRLNVDIHPSVGGRVTLNATDQTLPQLLERIAAQSDVRYEIVGDVLRVQPDSPYMGHYSVDYVNVQRNVTHTVSASSSLGQNRGSGLNSGAGNGGTASIASSSDNRFWDSLVGNLCQIVLAANAYRSQRDVEHERERVQEREDRLKIALELARTVEPAKGNNSSASSDLMRQVMGSSDTNASAVNPSVAATCGNTAGNTGPSGNNASNPLLVNRESGVLGVYTTSKGHAQVRTFLDKVLAGARRQVLIEATVVEVVLSAASQSGINWQQVVNSGQARGLSIGLGATGTGVANLSGNNTASILSLGFNNGGRAGVSSITSAIALLESFGQTKVLSSPKLSVMNNQTALIKVVEDYVYVTVQYTPGQRSVNASGGVTVTTPDSYTSVVNTVPLGLVMTVTPQISESDEVTLNVRPAITRLVREITDPNPALLGATTPIINKIPVVQSRELESVLRVPNGEIAVLGGLMQESSSYGADGLPGTTAEGGSWMLGQRTQGKAKSELVVFMRPVVIKEASIHGDYKAFRPQLPDGNFFQGTPHDAWNATPVRN